MTSYNFLKIRGCGTGDNRKETVIFYYILTTVFTLPYAAVVVDLPASFPSLKMMTVNGFEDPSAFWNTAETDDWALLIVNVVVPDPSTECEPEASPYTPLQFPSYITLICTFVGKAAPDQYDVSQPAANRETDIRMNRNINTLVLIVR
jgi:hypothetical protein